MANCLLFEPLPMIDRGWLDKRRSVVQDLSQPPAISGQRWSRIWACQQRVIKVRGALHTPKIPHRPSSHWGAVDMDRKQSALGRLSSRSRRSFQVSLLTHRLKRWRRCYLELRSRAASFASWACPWVTVQSTCTAHPCQSIFHILDIHHHTSTSSVLHSVSMPTR